MEVYIYPRDSTIWRALIVENDKVVWKGNVPAANRFDATRNALALYEAQAKGEKPK